MESVLWILVILLLAGAGILSARLCCYRRQMKHMLGQMAFLEEEDSNYHLSSACPVGKTQEVISAVNGVIDRFRREERKLKKINKSYRESITSISHDIRTPLTSVKGYVQMLQNSDIPAEKKEAYLEIIERRLEDLSDMLNQLFEYARIEAGERKLHLEKLNVGNLFAETISMFYEDFVKKGCEPAVEICEKPCYIMADRQAFVRIIENLMKNALVHGVGDYKFALVSSENQVAVQISNETDTIEEKDLERIFERFYTTDQSRSRKTTGLGLAIAKEFTEQMGGEIQAYFRQGYFTVEVRFEQLQPGSLNGSKR